MSPLRSLGMYVCVCVCVRACMRALFCVDLVCFKQTVGVLSSLCL